MVLWNKGEGSIPEKTLEKNEGRGRVKEPRVPVKKEGGRDSRLCNTPGEDEPRPSTARRDLRMVNEDKDSFLFSLENRGVVSQTKKWCPWATAAEEGRGERLTARHRKSFEKPPSRTQYLRLNTSSKRNLSARTADRPGVKEVQGEKGTATSLKCRIKQQQRRGEN